MGKRLDLHALLKAVTNNVYFQPPETLKMSYPCIVYARDYAETEFADNDPYSITKRYQVTAISQNPDDTMADEIAKLRMCIFKRFFVSDGLNHDVYDIFF